ncbi:MAG: hypothetical protein ACRCSN_14535 [Dermatophilaceae bacterium]
MLFRFFGRRVLRVGVLRSRVVRIALVFMVVGFIVVCSGAAYLFLQPLVADERAWQLLFGTATVSLVLWAQIAFLVIKVLFVNADGLVQFTLQLPVTNRERSAALTIYEAGSTMAVATAGALPLVMAALVLLGPAAVPPVLHSVILPVALTYVALSLIWVLLGRLCVLVRLRSIASVLLVLAVFVLIVTYAAQMNRLVLDVSLAYLGRGDTVAWVTSLAWFARRFGSWAAIGGASLTILALGWLALRLAPAQHPVHSRYLDVPVGPWLRRKLGPYDWSLARSSHTALSAVVAVAIFLYLCVTWTVHPVWACAVLTIGALYQFAATEPLRMMVGKSSTPWQIYGRMIKAQLLLLGAAGVPAVAVVGIIDADAAVSSVVPALGCVAGMIVNLCVGVIFPTEKDNPLSVLIGLSLTVVLLGLGAVGLGVLNLPPIAMTGSLLGVGALFVWYAVQGIRISESRRRHEQGTVGREFHRRSSAADVADCNSDTALSDVLDR